MKRQAKTRTWHQQHVNDFYVKQSVEQGYRSRSAYKLMEIDDQDQLLKPGTILVDLGCAPGGWCQVAVVRVNALGDRSTKAQGPVLGVDLQAVEPIAGAVIHQLDFLEDGADDKV